MALIDSSGSESPLDAYLVVKDDFPNIKEIKASHLSPRMSKLQESYTSHT